MALVEAQQRYSHIFARAEREHYVEPPFNRRLFEVENFSPPGTVVFDPCCGFGQIPRAALDARYRAQAADIVDVRKITELGLAKVPFTRRDFLRSTSRVRNIVTNPLFDSIRAFCERAVKLADKAALVSPLPRLPAARWLQALPLRRIWLLTPRPSMPPAAYLEAGGRAQGGRPEFCRVVFEHGWRGHPELRWLNRDPKAGT